MLAEYNKNPYNVFDREITFSPLYEKFYELSGKAYSKSSINCTKTAYKHCSPLYGTAYRRLRVNDFWGIPAQENSQDPPFPMPCKMML